MTFIMRPKPPFDFEKSVQMHSRFKNSLPDIYEDGVYKRVLHTGKKPVLVSVSSQGTTRKPKLLIDAYPPQKSGSEADSLRCVLGSMLEPAFDFNDFYVVAKKDAVMRTIAGKLRGLRPIRPPTIFESVIIAITEQQISLHAAVAIRSRLIRRYGDTVVHDGCGRLIGLFHAWAWRRSGAGLPLRCLKPLRPHARLPHPTDNAQERSRGQRLAEV
jgi:DNA-3-methyladenine glycosylase II